MKTQIMMIINNIKKTHTVQTPMINKNIYYGLYFVIIHNVYTITGYIQ